MSVWLVPPQRKLVAPFSTGHYARYCRACGQEFKGIGTLCPIHLGEVARKRAFELQAERARSQRIIAAREAQAKLARGTRTEFLDELDLYA